MIVRGSKIKLVKPMGVFDKIGEIFEVVRVDENAVITFKCSIGYGCMSYDELDRYFEVEDNKELKNKFKRQWTNWEYDSFIYYNIEGNSCVVPVKYRNNGKIVDLRTDWENATEDKPNLRAKATCNKNDKFDFDSGLDLADYRMQIKFLKRKLEDMIDKM